MESPCAHIDLVSSILGEHKARLICRIVEEVSKQLSTSDNLRYLLSRLISEGRPLLALDKGLADRLVNNFRNINLDEPLLREAIYEGIALAVDRIQPRLKDEWFRPVCPVCGYEAQLGFIERETRVMYLKCGRCGYEWRVARAQCPYCGSSRVSYRTFSKAGWLRVYTCEECLRSWIVVDEEKAKDENVRLPPRLLYYPMVKLLLEGVENV